MVVKLEQQMYVIALYKFFKPVWIHMHTLITYIMVSPFHLFFQQFSLLRPSSTLINIIIFAFYSQISVTSLSIALLCQEMIC